jgi:hypothetical protein
MTMRRDAGLRVLSLELTGLSDDGTGLHRLTSSNNV